MQRYFILIAMGLLGWVTFSFGDTSVPETKVSHRPGEFIKAIKNDPKAGQKIYQEFCASCHAKKPSIELHAPRKGVKKDWEPYLKQNIETLLKWADQGMRGMPPRGGCFECTDQNLKDAIIYMLPNSEETQ